MVIGKSVLRMRHESAFGYLDCYVSNSSGPNAVHPRENLRRVDGASRTTTKAAAVDRSMHVVPIHEENSRAHQKYLIGRSVGAVSRLLDAMAKYGEGFQNSLNILAQKHFHQPRRRAPTLGMATEGTSPRLPGGDSSRAPRFEQTTHCKLPRLQWNTSRLNCPPTMQRLLFIAASSFFLLCRGVASRANDEAQVAFFEKKIRPVLVQRCYKCHSEKAEGGLRLSSASAVLRGGDSGAAVKPANPMKACC